MLPSLKCGVCKYWLYLFFSSLLQNNTCTSKQPPLVSMCLSCSPEMHCLPLSKPSSKKDPEQNKTTSLLPYSQENLCSGFYSLPTCPWKNRLLIQHKFYQHIASVGYMKLFSHTCNEECHFTTPGMETV